MLSSRCFGLNALQMDTMGWLRKDGRCFQQAFHICRVLLFEYLFPTVFFFSFCALFLLCFLLLTSL